MVVAGYSPAAAPDIETFLAQDAAKELMRFTTAGSVDDGKSTLIGRLLYDCKSVYEDQMAAVKQSKVNRSSGPIDFSLLTDGLRAEREQGITIDVAYRYFSTPRRKFIIADTPGHEQYTRNMATGASTADLAVILIDARNGVLQQSRRHAYISTLLGIPRLLVAVNKMDLVEFRQDVFEEIRREFSAFLRRLDAPLADFVPISALDGDNVVSRSGRTPWYEGPSLLEFLETALLERQRFSELRFPVQYVIRPDLNFRGYAGQVASGVIHKGERVMVLPSGRTSRVKAIHTFDGELQEAFSPLSVTVCLEDEIDVSRGDMLVNPSRMPHVSRRLEADLVWMHETPLETGRLYLLKHTTQQVQATVTAIRHRTDVNTLEGVEARQLNLNEIGRVAIETHRPLYFDSYKRSRVTGAFILIDPLSNATVAAGMIEAGDAQDSARKAAKAALMGVEFETSRPTPAERAARLGHQAVTVWMTARRDAAELLERMLFDRGCHAHLLADETESHLLPELARISTAAGLITVCSIASDDASERERARELVGADRFVAVDSESISPDDRQAADEVCRVLEDLGFIRKHERFLSGEGI